ncbi:hypothetical protein OHC33_001240 [Knufia fluminis]|uniref:C2H2-type domain-containing protein n=1 Tax=Knufia fluminis TaxID=191047 RepID=A0AAN8EWZ8_9EURO|nr:hypothetical protein OHC33_001240 [Knufia fluminis]
MSVRDFYSMSWETPQYDTADNGSNYGSFSSNQLRAQNVPRSAFADGTIAPEVLSRNPAMYYPQDRHERGSRESSSSGNSNEATYAYSSYSYSPGSGRHFSSSSRQTPVQRTASGIDFEDRTQIPPSRTTRYYCEVPDCIDENTGLRSSVGRKADLKRHMQSVHDKPHIDCKYKKCDRKGDNGFRRQDHYREHLRGYHSEPSPEASTRRRGS